MALVVRATFSSSMALWFRLRTAKQYNSGMPLKPYCKMANEEKLDLSSCRGCRDFLPEEKLLRDSVQCKLETVFRSFGFNPLETPALERLEVLSSKYAGGSEILKETYRFNDQGGRELALRYDLTVSMSRVVAGNPSLALPFKRYQIASVWRDGPIKLGRYREFVQCDVDTVGAAGGIADAEVIAVACAALDALGFSYEVRVNNRRLLNGVLEWAGVEAEQRDGAVLAIDKLAKIGRENVEKELLGERGVSVASTKKIMQFLALAEGNVDFVLEELSRLLSKFKDGAAGITELMEVLDYLESFGVRDKVVFDASLARGLSYYTGTVFEGFLKNSSIKGSICGGGRYDGLVGALSGKPLPAVGISLGMDVIMEALKERGSASNRSVVRVFVAPIKSLDAGIKVSQKLREGGVNVALDLLERSVSKNLDYASKQGIPFVAIVGPREAKENKLTLRNMKDGSEKTLSVEEAIARLAD